jgi:hypothetical protein
MYCTRETRERNPSAGFADNYSWAVRMVSKEGAKWLLPGKGATETEAVRVLTAGVEELLSRK